MSNCFIKEKRRAVHKSYFKPLKIKWAIKGIEKYIISAQVKRKMKKCGNKFFISIPQMISGEKYMEIGENFHAGEGLIMQCIDEYEICGGEKKKFCPSLKIGNNVHVGYGAHIGCICSIAIGDNLLTGRNTLILDHNHGMGTMAEKKISPIGRPLHVKGKIEIGNNVWLGENVAVLSGVVIGDNVTVGANSVVTKDLPDDCIAAGVPAKIIRIKS